MSKQYTLQELKELYDFDKDGVIVKEGYYIGFIELAKGYPESILLSIASYDIEKDKVIKPLYGTISKECIDGYMVKKLNQFIKEGDNEKAREKHNG